MRLLTGIPTPAIESIIERHRCLELGKVILVHARVSGRRRQQSGALRNKVGPRRVGAAHDLGKVEERLRSEAKLLDHRIERAGLVAMAPEHALNVERRGIEALRDSRHLRGADKEKDGIGIDEATDQPGAGDAVNLRPATRHPQSATLLVTRWNLIGA